MGRITPIYESPGRVELGPRLGSSAALFNLLGDLRGHIPETLPAAMLDRLQHAFAGYVSATGTFS